jgi:hypothetical protein
MTGNQPESIDTESYRLKAKNLAAQEKTVLNGLGTVTRIRSPLVTGSRIRPPVPASQDDFDSNFTGTTGGNRLQRARLSVAARALAVSGPTGSCNPLRDSLTGHAQVGGPATAQPNRPPQGFGFPSGVGPGLGGGGGVTLIGARVTPNSGFFVGDGGLGDQESWLRHTGGGLAVVAGGGGAGGVFDAAGGTPLGTGWALLGGGLAVVDAWGVTLVDCSAPRDASITADTTIAASAAAASVAAAALVPVVSATIAASSEVTEHRLPGSFNPQVPGSSLGGGTTTLSPSPSRAGGTGRCGSPVCTAMSVAFSRRPRLVRHRVGVDGR